jgi:hypothetical protein
MKKLFVIGKTVLLLSCIGFISSCSTNNRSFGIYPKDETARKFADDSSVNAVLQFSSWDYTFLTRPQYLEGGFLQMIRRDNVGKVLDQMKVPRGTVAVVVGWTYNGEALDQVVSDWKTILNGCGFQRVVILRAQLGNSLNGSVIIDDSSKHLGALQSPARGG